MTTETGTLVRTGSPDGETSARELYERDFYAWALEQAAAVREGRADLDRENLAEEIEELGGSAYDGLGSAFRVLLLHMLKWDHQPERMSRSWAASIAIQRVHIEQVIARHPSLRRRQAEAVASAFRRSRLEAVAEMDRSPRSLPADCPYTLDETLARPFDWPDA